MAIQAGGYPNYTGYSGAPGRQACSISCHHQHSYSPTVILSGFPESYTPDRQYTIAVSHNGGGSFSNYNCSVRIGAGSSNAGVLASGIATTVYSVSGETNGIHASVSGTNSSSFLWTAPEAGTGEVRLYWAGLQGGLSNGADTQIVLVSTENTTGMGDYVDLPKAVMLRQNYPNPFNSETNVSFSLDQPDIVELIICNILGQTTYDKNLKIHHPGIYSIIWDGRDRFGVELPSGVYLYSLRTSNAYLTRRMILLR
jgi:hypothetical protein